MCLFCFVVAHGWEPEMGDECSTFAPGRCSNCGADQICFHVNEEFAS